MLVAHPGGVGLEVAQCGVQFFGFDPGQREGGRRTAVRDVAVVESPAAFGDPGGVLVAEDEGEQLAQVVQVLAGVVQVDDLGGFGEVLAGQVPDPVRAVAEDGELADVAGAAAAGLGGHQHAESAAGAKVAR